MKKLLVLLFIPIVCFGQEKKDILYFDFRDTLKKYVSDITQVDEYINELEKLRDGYYVDISQMDGLLIEVKEQLRSESNPAKKQELTSQISAMENAIDEYKLQAKNDVGDKWKNAFSTILEAISNDYNNLLIIDTSLGFTNISKIYIDKTKGAGVVYYDYSPISEWIGNGSGIIISESGYIITNNHVIEDANEIEVELNSNGKIQKFGVDVVQTDLRNDLAILKISDVDFNSFESINYNFKSRSSAVGTKIYTFGYPKALSGMGKEIKVTEGIISSKSGIMGDITTYQITAPIQGGNSGGPLFDDKGNLVGINSSKFNSNETENVNYSIKSSYVLNLIDVLPKSIDLPSSTKLQSLPLTEQIKEISKYVVLVKVK
tara:strand:- start:1185 stop:2309 length:1125 start_codon:yes stop_codon:yes gene_type:complete